MTKNNRKNIILLGTAGLFAVLFIILVVLVKCVDVAPIGPLGSTIGLATINSAIWDAIGVSQVWYDITDWLGIVALVVAGIFAVLGIYQLIKGKSLKKVDKDIIYLGIFYAIVLCAYVLFEFCIVNYRPVLMDGGLEASFPSSHTMLVVCIMGSSIYQCIHRIKQNLLKYSAVTVCSIIIAITVIGRLLSGVHWFTDIMGGIFLSTAFILAYIAVATVED